MYIYIYIYIYTHTHNLAHGRLPGGLKTLSPAQIARHAPSRTP